MKQWSIKLDELGWYIIRDEQEKYVDAAGSLEQAKVFAAKIAQRRGIEIELITTAEETDDHDA